MALCLGTANSADRTSIIRVATFNVDHGLDLPGLIRALGEHRELGNVDVLMVQEIEVRSDLDGPRELAEALGLELLYAAARPLEAGSHGLAILSREELIDPEIVALPRYDLGYRSRPRVGIGATLVDGARRVRLFNVHLDTRITLDDRIAQLEPILSRVAEAPYAIIGGDVNTIRALPALLPWLPLPLPGVGQAAAFDRFMQRRGFEAPVAELGSTGPLSMRLDSIYTRGVDVRAKGKAWFRGISDHAALWIDVALSEDGSSP